MNVPIDISKTILNTQRLILRPWKETDLDDLFAYARVDGVGQLAGWLPHQSKEDSAKILKLFIEEKKTFALEHEGRVIGSLGIERYDEKRFPELDRYKGREIGYVLAKDHWGRGLMTEAVKEVIRYLFEEADLDVILCGHFLRNRRSQRVQEKCGFVHYAYGSYRTLYGTDEDDEINILWRRDSII